jgi:hypothetical protein
MRKSAGFLPFFTIAAMQRGIRPRPVQISVALLRIAVFGLHFDSPELAPANPTRAIKGDPDVANSKFELFEYCSKLPNTALLRTFDLLSFLLKLSDFPVNVIQRRRASHDTSLGV